MKTAEPIDRRIGEIDAITDNIPALIAYTDAQGRYLHANRAYREWMGVAPEKMLGRTVGDLLRETLGEEYWRQVRPGFERALRGERVSLEAEGQYPDRRRHVEIHYTPDCDSDGKLRGVVCLVVDVSERKLAEAELQHRARLLDQSLEPMFTWAPGRGITYWNQAAERLYGYGREEAIGKSSHQLLRTRFWCGVEEFEARLMREGAWTGELIHSAKDGREVIVDSIHRLVDYDTGPLVLETNRDITEKRRAQEALQETDDRLRRAIGAGRVGVWEVEGPSGALAMSENVEGLFGLARGSARTWTDLVAAVAKEGRPELEEAYRRAMELHETVDCDIRIVAEDGSARWLRVTARVAGEGGRPARMSGAAWDITEVKNANVLLERSVEERTRALQEALRELESFSYSVSHDLRAPLRSVEGFGQLLLKDYADGRPLDKTGLDYLRRMNRAAARMGGLIDDLLDLSRIGRAPMRARAVDLSAIAAEITDAQRLANPQRKVEIRIQLGVLAVADPGLARVLLENLLLNAWKYSSKVERAEIEFGQLKTDEPTYYVKDNGAGFDMRHAQNLFTPFHRLHRAAEFEGTGVGLATVQRIVRRHGGKVWAQAAIHQGATFYFTLGGADEGQADPAGGR
jgi:PAS domain S-box-containing protein